MFYAPVPPEMTKGPGNVRGIEGEEFVITCQASAMPNATFTFFKVIRSCQTTPTALHALIHQFPAGHPKPVKVR